MLSALLLFAAAVSSQDVYEKITVQHTPAYDIYRALVPDHIKGKVATAGIKRLIYDPTDNTLIAQGTPEAIQELRLLIEKLDEQNAKPQERSVTIPLRNQSAQYIYEIVTQTGRWKSEFSRDDFLPKGLKLKVDKQTNGIIVQGPDASIREFELMVGQFDVKSRQVTIEVDASIPLMDRTFSTSGTISNNSSLNYNDDATDTWLKVSPRINGDGAILIIVTGGALGTHAYVFARVKPGETIWARIYPGQRTNSESRLIEDSVVSEYSTGSVPSGFLLGSPIPVDSEKFRWDGGAVALYPKEAELRLVIKVKLPAQ